MAVKSIDLATTTCQFILLVYRVPIRPAIGISGTLDGLSAASPYSRFALYPRYYPTSPGGETPASSLSSAAGGHDNVTMSQTWM